VRIEVLVSDFEKATLKDGVEIRPKVLASREGGNIDFDPVTVRPRSSDWACRTKRQLGLVYGIGFILATALATGGPRR
jgi:hypothetical protein